MMGADCGQHHRGAISTGMLISWAFAWRQHIITVVLCGKTQSFSVARLRSPHHPG